MRPWRSNIPFAANSGKLLAIMDLPTDWNVGNGKKSPLPVPTAVKMQYGSSARPSEFAIPTKSSAWQPAEGATGPLQPGPQSGHRIDSAHEDLFRVHRCWRPILYRCRPEDRRDAPRKRRS